VTEAEVVTEGNTNIVVSLAGKTDDRLKDIGAPAELRFRKVLKVTNGAPLVAPTGTPTPTASGSAPPTKSPGATAPATTAPATTAPATPPPATGAPATGAPSAAPAVPGNPEMIAAVKKKVGAALYAQAEALTAPVDTSQNPAAVEPYKKFGELTPVEVAALPVPMQFNVPAISCDQLNKRAPGSVRDASKQAVACEGATKYLLDVSKVQGTDVNGASAVLPQNGSDWAVSLDFTGSGQSKWTALTREAFNNEGQACDASALGDQQKCLVAVVLDNEVVSAPQILGVLSSGSQITGSFTRSQADLLASQLRYGALPLTFNASEAQTVSATLGVEHLRAGLLAAGVGMLLVIIYAFFYYRLLGTVIFLSLILSGLLVFGALIVLGRQIGFTLTLAGIAGFIVSLGVAADSFVIYFERLKDEIRDGRSPRSAVPRAWARARRTIISANAISIMAAVVLYVVSVGTVKGFAFALGLATILDLVVVFLFRHPIMTMFANTKAFLSPKVSGLGRVLEKDPPSTPAAPRTPRAKEA
jgi:preprotein translocase subunit SecD